ncbi:hypothetical protein [Burkholderia multivorans]|uniref:hypothetical protein n=1 Tax=Burkholderia multivorans TaxID=87883 RepID=UPI00075326BE|nr:hypothetical protein [Burkholderia multivorans]KVT46695.1 hypothetical protein WK52_00055 [Burkholderia multivorans]MBR8020756.1 hypothetical protein [Burkholderia multivorans]MBU9227317.1 hypothetical protein [Burkholderia multivorans]MBU9388512.1 hypothetical protein [Burkholderia multivorans]MDN8032924.1 hypothetical protein [Burkholderia multivorans]
MRLEHHTYKAVSNGDDASCTGCVFDLTRDDIGCATHACSGLEWPEDDPLHEAKNIIWINPQ